MTGKKGVEDMGRYLTDCSPECAFWVNNGPILKNLQELSEALRHMQDDQFVHHVNREKNDFCKWIDEVIGDHHLAAALGKARTRTATLKKVNERLAALGKKVAS
ncbi:hypothetical protein HYY74_04235 [Candidatus Woesearchaeota archaeon]|nr:hypothetical protein [Candidatus Woesearchaeota archaeon]